MNTNQIVGIYQGLNGLSSAFWAKVSPKTIMKISIKTLSIVAIVAIAFALGGAGLAEAQSASSVTCNSAVLQGQFTITPAGTPLNVWFNWGNTQALGNTTPQQSVVSTGSVQSHSAPLTNLQPNTTYWYQATGSVGTPGQILSFTTPSCTGGGALYTITASAGSGGTISPSGNVPVSSGGSQTFTINANSGSSITSVAVDGVSQGAISTYTFSNVTGNHTITAAFTGSGTGGGLQQALVMTSNISGDSQTGVVLNGYVDPRGVPGTTAWFEWGTNQNAPFGQTTPAQPYSNATNYSYSIGGLNTNTTYYYRAVATNANGTVYGQVFRLYPVNYGGYNPGTNYNPGTCYNCGGNYTYNPYPTNYGNAPIVNTYSPNVQQTFAVLNGYVDPNGNQNTTRWFEWGTNQYSLGNTTNKSSQSYAGTFSENAVNLLPNTVYYYRAAAQSSYGTTYGQIMSFTTGTGTGATYASASTGVSYSGTAQVVVVTNAPTALTGTSARLNGLANLVNTGTPTNGWFEWGTSTGLGNTTATKNIGSDLNNYFYEYISGLSDGTTYYYRAVAQNQYGIFRGDIRSFVARTYVASTVSTSATTYVSSTVVKATRVSTSQTALINLVILSDDETIARGDVVTFTVIYTNISKEKLHDVALRVTLPFEFSYIDSSRGVFSEKDNTLTVDIGDLAPGEEGRVTLKARLNQAPDPDKALVVTANMVYTTPADIQEEVIAYVIEKYIESSTLTALAFWSGGFFPDTLLGWLLLIIILIILVILSRFLYGNYRESRNGK